MKRAFFVILALGFLSCGAARAQWDKDVFFFRGRQSLSDGKYAQAIENFNILARLDTTDYWTFFFRGIAKYNLGDSRGAQSDFNTSIRLNPLFTNGYHYRAITLSRSGEYDRALEDIERAMELRPGTPGLYFTRGVTCFLARRFDQAVSDFDHYIRKEPSDPGAYLNRGASYLFLGDTLKALSDYNKAIKIDRFEPEGYIRRGRVYASMERYTEAVEDISKAIDLDTTNTFAYFNRAIMYYEMKDYNAAMADLDRVLKEEPGNALTLYNRSLIRAQVGDFENALDDMDRVININPGNVLAYYNRAAFFAEMGRWQDAADDYTRAIELYPDFAKAYMNRSYVENMLGRRKDSKRDYETAQQKVREYREKNSASEGSFADTTKKYSALLDLDADFAKKDFDNELLQHRDIDIRLKHLYRFSISDERKAGGNILSNSFEDALVERFVSAVNVPVVLSNTDTLSKVRLRRSLDSILSGDSASGAGRTQLSPAATYFVKGLYDVQDKQYSSALAWFDKAVAASEEDPDRFAPLYKAFYLMNRGVLRAEMIDFIASIESNVRTLTMDDSGTTRARVSDAPNRTYDYSEAVDDMLQASELLPDMPYVFFNLGNLYCLSSRLVESIENYDRAISLYPGMGDAYYNRGLVLIFLKDKEKGCIDLSKAGELGIGDAYSVIDKYCKEQQQ